MHLNESEVRFLTTLAQEQNQTGCRGPAHDLIRKHVYPDAPRTGSGSLAFAYEALPLIGLLLQDFKDLQQLDDFLRKEPASTEPRWPWASAEQYLTRLDEARQHLRRLQQSSKDGDANGHTGTGVGQAQSATIQ